MAASSVAGVLGRRDHHSDNVLCVQSGNVVKVRRYMLITCVDVSTFYWPTSVADWRYSSGFRRNITSPDPGLPLGREGITDPCFTNCLLQVCQVYCILLPDVLLVCMASCTNVMCAMFHLAMAAYKVMGASAAALLAFTAPILVLHTLYYKSGLALLWRSGYVCVSVEIITG